MKGEILLYYNTRYGCRQLENKVHDHVEHFSSILKNPQLPTVRECVEYVDAAHLTYVGHVSKASVKPNAGCRKLLPVSQHHTLLSLCSTYPVSSYRFL